MANEDRRGLGGINLAVSLKNSARVDLSVSGTAAQTAALTNGVYDVWSTVDTFLKVAETADDVTTANGYLIRANTTIPVFIPEGNKLGAIAGGTGTLSLHRINWYAD